MATNWVDEVLSGATSTGSKTISLANDQALSVANTSSENLFTVTSDTSNGGFTSILGIEGQEAILFLGADNADDAGDVWQIQADASGNLKIGNRTVGTGSPERGNTIVDAITIDSSRNISVGVDDTGYDVKFFGATSGQYMLWDESADELVLTGDSKLSFHDAAGGENIIATSDGHLEINAGTTLDITAPTVDVNVATELNIDGNVDLNGALDVSGALTGTALTVDNVIVNGTTIGHTDDTDLLTVADGSLTIAGDLIVAGGVTSGTSSSVHSIHVSDGSTSSMNMGNEAEIVITDDGIPRIYFEDTGEGTNDKLMAIANYHENFVVQSLVDDGESYDTESILVCNRDGRVGIGTRTFDSSAVNYLTILNGTEPSAHTDNQIYIGSKDSAGTGTDTSATLALFCEENVDATAMASDPSSTFTHRFPIWINGTAYWIALDPV